MCGIFGIISNNSPINKSKLQSVSKVISHRGPDDEGYLLFDLETMDHKQYRGSDSIDEIQYPHISNAINYNATFLHRRLSIIDLTAAGHQPMSYDNGDYWITYNGEIYNYIEIREELEKEGVKFSSHSDTEVILASYRKWGTDCVNKFNGMWAFAIWDKKEKLLFLSRDRFGIKPLYYCSIDGQFLFCSEIKGINTYLNKKLKVNERSLFNLLYNGDYLVGETDESMFENVRQLMPGSNLIFDGREIKIEKYWDLKYVKNQHSFYENLEIFKELFLSSIKLRLRSDVEVGSCLSGGIDSSSIVSFASSVFNKKFHTLSAIWPGENCDESSYISDVNIKYNCIRHTFKPSIENIEDIVKNVVYHQEIPIPGASLLAQWFVMQEAKKSRIKVLLDGQGADEILAGYPSFVRTYLRELLYTFKFAEVYKNLNIMKESDYNFRRIIGVNKNLLNKNGKPYFPIKKYILNKFGPVPKSEFFTKVKEQQKYQIQVNPLPHLLHYEDRNSMAHSIETRLPYLDYRLVQFAINLPTEHKINGKITKVLLRESMKNYLPESIYNRTDKIGFATPIEKNIFNNSHFFEKLKNNGHLREFIEVNELKVSNNNNMIFKLYALDIFLNEWL